MGNWIKRQSSQKADPTKRWPFIWVGRVVCCCCPRPLEVTVEDSCPLIRLVVVMVGGRARVAPAIGWNQATKYCG